ncbi:efflux RND transporter permease subunit [Phormidium sp. CLA17]|uniref:efflux RND transporter permease subunit n=1 Tax=Leptolyngbya sp. Cla-17 TaxID=2803751 RepID=UPI00149295E4|nr:efflux RND transporter permease subunit [Leptolyngbya sp. Cla-17]MBM0742071.1 efflux RND transporter permease subunit [Leptolyngbya sp. Cla-17]
MDKSSPESARSRFNISKTAIQRPILTLSFWLAVVVAGVLAFSSLKYALFPDVTFPVVVVNASAPLKTAVDTEQKLTNPIEATLSRLEQVDGVGSTTYPGQSVVRLRFAVGTNLEESSRIVAAALKTVKLPAKTTTKVIPVNLNEAAVVSYAIDSSSQNLKTLSKTAKDQIIPAIAKLPGVLKVTLLGEPSKLDLTKPPKLEDLTKSGNLVRFNGQEAIAFQVVKKSDANTLEVVRAANQEVERLRTKLPQVQFSLAATQADYIEAATDETVKALIEAMVLSAIVIYPFLWNWQATVISALAIPMSLLGTFIVMAFYGFNFETITLLALALVIGNVVDDAIVDVENIARHLEEGETPKQAAISATDEIGLTVTAATLTAIAVFLPVGTMGGVLGQFFRPFGITISAAMITSLLVARTLSPLLAAAWLKPPKPRNQTHPSIADRFQRGFDRLNHQYQRLLQWSLHHKGIVMAIALASFVGGLALIPLIPKGFIPKLDRGEFNISYSAPTPEIPEALKQALSGQVISQGAIDPRQLPPGVSPEQLAAQRSAQPLPEFDPLKDSLQVAKQLDEFVQRSPDVASTFTVVGSRQGEPNKGTIYVKLKDNRTTTTANVQDRFRRDLPKVAGVTTSIEDIQFVDTGGDKPVQVQIQGNDLNLLDRTAQKIQTRLTKIAGLVDVSATTQANSDGIREIQHDNKQRVATISANLGQGLTIGEAGDRATTEAKAVLPAGISLRLGGDSARIDDILGSFGKTLALSLLCIVAVLFVLFRRWTDTLVIFLSLPLSIVGAMVGLLIAQSDFGMISLIGIIFLLGLTSKNAILIVDYINQLRRSGLQRDEAILKAGPVRLRPILMTTVATLLGMLPIAIGWGAGAELRAPMAIAIMGGLITSTLLSLIVIPVLYALLDNLDNAIKHSLRRKY